MKIPVALWIAIFLLTFAFGGPILAVVVTALSAGTYAAGVNKKINALDSSHYRSLR